MALHWELLTNKKEEKEEEKEEGEEKEEKSLWDSDKLLVFTEFLFPHLKNKRAAQLSLGSISQFSNSSPLAPGTPFPAPALYSHNPSLSTT